MLHSDWQWTRDLHDVQSTEEFRFVLAQPLARCGFHEFVFVPARSDRIAQLEASGTELLKRYDEESLRAGNTIFSALRSRRSAITWDAEALWKRASESIQRRLWECVLESGYRSGASVPLHGPDNAFSHLTCIARKRRRRGKLERMETADELILIGTMAVTAFDTLRRTPPTPSSELTRREVECLLWSAKGKTAWEVGRILGISSRTVHFHIQNIMHKLDASTKAQAIHEATRLGLLPVH